MLPSVLKRAFGASRYGVDVDSVRRLIDARKLQDAEHKLAKLSSSVPQFRLHRACLAAELDFYRGNDDQAEAAFLDVLSEAPGFAYAHYGLSLVLLEKGQAEAALEHAQFAKTNGPRDPRFLSQLGVCFLRVGNSLGAEDVLKQATQLNRRDKFAWNNLGFVNVANGSLAAGVACFRRACHLDPEFTQARRNLEAALEDAKAAGLSDQPRLLVGLGVVGDESLAALKPAWIEDLLSIDELLCADSTDAALAKADELTQTWPEDVDAACWAARAYLVAGDVYGGMENLQVFMTHRGRQPKALAVLAELHAKVADFERAAELFDEARELGERSERTLNEQAHVLMKLDRYSDGLDVLSVLRDEFDLLKYLPAYAAAMVSACRYSEAIPVYEQALAEHPQLRGALLSGYATCLLYTARYGEAREYLEELLAILPEAAPLRMMRGQLRLLHEEYGPGWDDYSLRGQTGAKHFRRLPIPKWQGEPLDDKRIVVLAEQGLGDQVMFASCLNDLLALRPKELIVEVVNRVAPTIARSFPECTVVPSSQHASMKWFAALEKADCFVPLGDLPRHFRRSRASFPGRAFLRADPARVAFWRERLTVTGPKPWLGFSWRGGVATTRAPARSMPAGNLAALAAGVGATWINLQYGDVSQDIASLVESSSLVHWPEAIADLDEFAALVTALDGVVTVCNTTVHYAGAVGQRVWVMCPKAPEWRYGAVGDTMPWYPAARVVRQQEVGVWSDVLSSVNNELLRTYLSSADKVIHG